MSPILALRSADLLALHVVWGSARYLDGEWDLMLLTVNYAGCEIDLGGVTGAKIYDRTALCWVPLGSRLETAIRMKVLGVEVPVIAKDALIDYKSRLGRDVDLMDVAAIIRSEDTSSVRRRD